MNKKIYFSHIVTSLLLVLWLSACQTTSDTLSIDHKITQKQLLSGTAILGMPLKDTDLPEDNVISLSKEMEDFLYEHVMTVKNKEIRARRLIKALFDKDQLGILYNSGVTLTAEDAFNQRIGNCLSFSYLYAAFAKKAGLNMSFQEVKIPLEWSLGTDQISLIRRHTNIRLKIRKSHDFIIDIDNIGIRDYYEVIPLTEKQIVALYYGNIGAEYILKEEYDTAYKYLVKALLLSPKDSSLWTNLGVIYRVKDLPEYAESAHFVALKYDEKNYSALNNLAYLYKQTGNDAMADYYMKQSKGFQEKDPYYRYYKAKNAIDEKEYHEALKHINYAISVYDYEADFYVVQSEIYKALGDVRLASQALQNA